MRKSITVFLFCTITTSSFAQNWDINTLRSINLNRNRSYDGAMEFISNTAAPVAFGAPLIFYAVGHFKKNAITKHKAIYMGTTVIVSTIISSSLKRIIKEDRPFNTYPDIEKLTNGGGYAMPSGHTSNAFALATSLSIVHPRWYVIVPSFAWAASVGYSRIHLGVHYPSDVIAGPLVGAGSAYLSYKVNKWLFHKKIT
jgi:membrane-associated phospholipid phosphatase